MLFPVLTLEGLVQERDKTRLDASQSYAVGESITQIEIKPTTADAYYDVTDLMYLDWQFTMTDPVNIPVEEFDVEVRLNGTESFIKTISIISEAKDNLFSTDDQLVRHEIGIMKFIPAGRATFKDAHRRAQTLILAWLNKESYIDDLGDPITVARLKSLEDVAEWSAMTTLRLIMESNANATDDVFSEKAKRYAKLEHFYKDRAIIRLDLNQDGVAGDFEQLDVRTCRVVRR